MNINKVICMVLSLLIYAVCIPVSASEPDSIKSITVAVIDGTIHVEAIVSTDKKYVTIEIINSQNDISALTDKEKENLETVFNYINQIPVPDSGIISISYPFRASMGTYRLRIAIGDVAQEKEIVYFTDAQKDNFISQMIKLESKEAMLKYIDDNRAVFTSSSLAYQRFFEKYDMSDIIDDIFNMRGKYTDFKTYLRLTEPLVVTTLLNSAKTVAEYVGYCDSFDDILDFKALSSQNVMQMAIMTDEIKNDIYEDLLTKSNEDVAQWQKCVVDTTVLACIRNMGYKDIKAVFDACNDVLKIDFNTFDKLLFDKQDDIFEAIAGKKFESTDALKREFDRLVALHYSAPVKFASSGGGSGRNLDSTGTVSAVAEISLQPSAVKFDDIDSVEWASDAIYRLCEKGIVSGRGNGRFEPLASVTRAEYTKLLISSFGLSDDTATVSFDDVSRDDWAYGYIASAFAMGIVKGINENTFGYDSNITREEAATMTYRLLRMRNVIATSDTLNFADNDMISEYAREAVASLASVGIIKGNENAYFNPNATLSRAEAVVIINRILK